MDWSVWLRWPSTILLILAAVMLLVTLMQLFVLRDRLQRGLRLSAGIRALEESLGAALVNRGSRYVGLVMTGRCAAHGLSLTDPL